MKQFIYRVVSFILSMTLVSCQECSTTDIHYFIANKSKDTIYVYNYVWIDESLSVADVFNNYGNYWPPIELAPDSFYTGRLMSVSEEDVPGLNLYAIVNSKETMRKHTKEDVYEMQIADEFITIRGFEKYGFLMEYKGKEEKK